MTVAWAGPVRVLVVFAVFVLGLLSAGTVGRVDGSALPLLGGVFGDIRGVS